MTVVTPLVKEPIGVISPRLYGHFAEHLARCCYDGLWVGNQKSSIPQIRGFRKDVLDALKAMPTPLLRWPGGCYADHYHWRDGVGPTKDRPVRLGLSCGLRTEDDNSLGTHEFLDLCGLIDAEPYLAGNIGSGSVQEMCDWVEYCNAEIGTSLAKERTQNGSPKPFGVRLWGVGNENWGCGGAYSPESYGLEYRRYATMLRHVDPIAELVVCGHDLDWNRRLMEALRNHVDLVDHFSIHRYWINGGHGADFDEKAYYRLLTEADETELFVQQTREIIQNVVGERRRIGIALDEWGVWHSESRGWGPDAAENPTPDYGQAATVRDAIAVAAALEGFHRQCRSLSLANLAQVVNVLQAPIYTSGEKMWVSPTYHVFRLHANHIGAEALKTHVQAPALPHGADSVTATSSRKARSVTITVTNRSIGEAADVSIAGLNSSTGTNVDAQLLRSRSPRDQNSASDPNCVGIDDVAVFPDGSTHRFVLPPHSVATVTLTN